MNMIQLAYLCIVILFPPPSQEHVGLGQSEDGRFTVSILTNDDGRLLDLAVTIDDTQIQRFPEANNTRILLPWNCYNFSIGKTDDHDALNVEIYGKIGQMKYRGQTILLECNWQ